MTLLETPCPPLTPAPDLLELTLPEQIEALIEVQNQRLLEALLARPSGVKALADALNLPLRGVHYRVRQLERLGLIRVQETRPRRGRPIKIYAPTAQGGWRFPFSRSSALSFTDLAMLYMEQHGRAFWREAEAHTQGELWVSFERYGPDSAGFNVQPENPLEDAQWAAQSVSGWFRLHLADAEAQSLAERLRALLEEYAFRPQGVGQREYLLGTFFSGKRG